MRSRGPQFRSRRRARTALHSLTEGNPRLLEIALQRHLLDETPLGSEDWLGGMLRGDVEAHLENLSEPAREVSEHCLGGRSGVWNRDLFHVLDKDPRELLDSLHEAGRSGLLRRTEIPGIYRFRQALFQEILNAELSGARRARLHQRFGEVLEALHPHDNTLVEKIASHFYEAALLGCADKAAEYCSRAAIQAYGESRVADGLRFYRMAMVALELQGSNTNAIADLKARLEDAAPAGSTGSCRGQMSPMPAKAPSLLNVPPTTKIKELRLSATRTRKAILRPYRRRGASAIFSRRTSMQENTFRREGDFWTLVFEDRVLRLKHSNGLLFVADLLQNPDRDFHAAQLLALLPSVERTMPREHTYRAPTKNG